MEKAAEVYTRLKSRVLGPKMEAIQKANKAGPEKDKGDVEKGQEKLSGGETQNEKGEEETNAGNVPCTSQGGSLLCLDVWQSQGCAQGTAGPPVDLGLAHVRAVELSGEGAVSNQFPPQSLGTAFLSETL